VNVKWQLLASQVEAKLAKMALGGAEQTRALGALGNAIANRVRLCFRLGVSPWGVPWKPLNPKYRTGKPLQDTGRLARSFTSQVQGDAVVVGTNVQYAGVHQFGATILPKNAKHLAVPVGGGLHFLKMATIPSRPFLPLVAGSVQLPPSWARSALGAMAKSMGL
jgi:phage virion morphogenesis protein